MNFLGHAFFSHTEAEVLCGNIMGDFVKGDMRKSTLPILIQEGVRRHRTIDRICDSTKSFLEMKKLFSPRIGHYKGVVVDILLDHFLAIYFNKFHPMPLKMFSAMCYEKIEQCSDYFTQDFKRVFNYMKRDNFFMQNLELINIQELLNSIVRRSPKAQGLEIAFEDIKLYYQKFEALFFQFMEEMKVLEDE
ncbi:MAG: ACP phosphodiesterase [Fusobacteria bacterium]|nr:ACP phosphodiesterase [Fusobacteriota bacterium]